MGHRVASGFAWVGLNTVYLKFVSLAMQVVLSWLLVPNDFGVIAAVTAFAAIGNPARLVTLSAFLSRRPAELDRWASSAVWLTSAAAIAGGIVMLAVAPFLAIREANSLTFFMCLLIAILSSSFESICVTYGGVLNAKMAFARIAKIGMVLWAFVFAGSVLMAWLGCGPYSTLVPLLLAGAGRLAWYHVAAGVRLRRSPERHLWKLMIVEGGWLSIAQYGYTILTQASYICLSWFHSPAETGVFYFAYTLAVQMLFMVSSGLSAVLLPALSQATSREHRRDMYQTSCRLLLLVTMPLCMVQVLAISPLVHLIFGSKWEASIPIAMVMSLGTLLRVVSFPSQAIFIAEGRPRLYAAWMVGGAIIFSLIAIAASWLGSPMTLTICVTAFFCLFDPLTGAMGYWLCGGSKRRAIAVNLWLHVPPLVGSLAGGLLAWQVQRWVSGLADSPTMNEVLQLCAAGLVLPVAICFAWALQREDARRMIDVFCRLILPRLPILNRRMKRTAAAAD
jgi:O-antigen/teichoic acid export membrane protein